MSKKIYEIVDKLPTSGLTIQALKTLDTFVPQKWENLVGFDNTIKAVTGETDEAMVQEIGERAIASSTTRNRAIRPPCGSTKPLTPLPAFWGQRPWLTGLDRIPFWVS